MCASSEITRLYISNLNFSTTEQELTDYFKDYGVVSVLIPSQTIRGFRSNQVRPLGIGYAEFESSEKVRQAIEDLNSKPFKGRELRLKPYVPYSPEHVTKKMSKARTLSKLRRCKKLPRATNEEICVTVEPQALEGAEIDANDSADNDTSTNPVQESKPATQNNGQNVAESQNLDANTTQEIEFSEDTVYCGYLPKAVTDLELREYFKEYNPQEIWIFRTKPSKSKHLQFHRHFTAALISLETAESIDKIVVMTQNKKLLGKKIIVKPAYLAKIEELKKMSAEKKLLEQINDPSIAEETIGSHEQQEEPLRVQTTENHPPEIQISQQEVTVGGTE